MQCRILKAIAHGLAHLRLFVDGMLLRQRLDQRGHLMASQQEL